MDPTSQRAVEEEVESHAPPVTEAGGRGEPAPPVPEALAQPPQAMFHQMAEFFRQMAEVMPLMPPPHRSLMLRSSENLGLWTFWERKKMTLWQPRIGWIELEGY